MMRMIIMMSYCSNVRRSMWKVQMQREEVRRTDSVSDDALQCVHQKKRSAHFSSRQDSSNSIITM